MKVTILFFSTSRYEYLFPMLESFEKQLNFEGLDIYKIFIDDYPKNRDMILLEYLKNKYKFDKMILNDKNLGYSVSWKKAWESIPEDTDYVYHQEDDLEILDKVNVNDMIDILQNSDTELHQVFLKRNIVYSGDNDFVRLIEENRLGKETEVNGKSIVTFNHKWFIPHCTLYPFWITKLPLDHNPQEGVIMKSILIHKPGSQSAMFGKRLDKNRIQHIGEYNQGQKCLEGEPGYTVFGKYDKDKSYYSHLYLKEWKGSRNYQMAELHLKYGSKEKSIEYYKKCVDEDSDRDKKYVVCLYLADLGNYIEYLHKAIEIYPERLEAWYRLMMFHKGKHWELSYAYGLEGYKKYKKHHLNDFFMKDYSVYEYKFLFEFCVICYYSGHKEYLPEISSHIEKEKTPDHIYTQHLKNQKFYRESFDNRPLLKYNTPSVLIIDNFLHNAREERSFALSQEFKVRGNFPGFRTKGFATQHDKSLFEKILNRKITYWPSEYNGCYQYCTKDMSSWIHRDRTTCSAIIYLSPEAPLSGGTKIYVHKHTKGTFEKDNINGVLDKDSQRFENWDECDVIGNKFNRLVIFQGIQSHMSNEYFGTNKENGRLFKIFFFDVEN